MDDMGDRKIKVLVVDDSALARRIIMESLSPFPDIEVIGTAADAYVARDKILALKPDVVTLDIEMPRMDGLTFLRLIMRHRPMPVIVVSSLTVEGSQKALEALECGAMDVMGKPGGASSACSDGFALAEKIKAAAVARLPKTPPMLVPSEAYPAERVKLRSPPRSVNPRSLIVMGASTGGTEALKTVLAQMPDDLPGICVVQHIPAQFSLAFANRLNSLCAMEVREAKHGDEVTPGLALIAPGGRHLLVRWNGSRYVALLNDGPAVHHQRPAVDVLFDSLVKAGGAEHSIGVLMTGMGKDGAVGLLNLRENGAVTIAQSESSCVVFGMPGEAIRIGGAKHVSDLDEIACEVERQSRRLSVREAQAIL
jgi:two-component system, chemotaxis family, protein-glutamate methylesterase/glutaminase